MSITATANDIHELRYKVGARAVEGNIVIRFRGGDYGRIPQSGCIVDATRVEGQEVPRKFETAGEAMRYIAGILKWHDAWVRKEKKRQEQERRQSAKKGKE